MQPILVAALAVIASPAAAAPVVFFGEDIAPADGSSIPSASAARAGFDAWFAGTVGVEDFESYAVGGQLPPEPAEGRLLPQARFVGGFGTIFANFDQAGGVANSALATSGTQTYADDEDTITVSVFSRPVNGIGFYGIDFATGPLTMNVRFDDNTVIAYAVGQSLSRGNIFFWGIADPARSIVSISGGTPLGTGGDFLNDTDDYVVGILPIPEPAAFGLFGVGLGLLAARRSHVLCRARR
jgi:hypothetical protein